MNNKCELSIVMPCLNEAETLAVCIGKARTFLEKNKISGEIIIADNGSEDGSQRIAVTCNTRLINVTERGYGAALINGIRAANGKYIIMADADDSYDLLNLMPFLEKLRAGYELVMGNRFKGGIKPGAMPLLHRYLGNPVLTGIGRLFFGSPIGDFHCGIRGFSKSAIERLDLHTTGMEFASEMVVKASLFDLNMTEVPTTLSPDGRSRPPHLRSWRDGWRHLRFLLLYSPHWLFFYPGITLILLGTFTLGTLLPGPRTFKGITFDIHTMLYAATAVLLGVQAVNFSFFSKMFSINMALIPENQFIRLLLKFITLERGLILGVVLTILGLIGSIYGFYLWSATQFGTLLPTIMMRTAIPSLTLIAGGVQIIFASFFLGVLRIKHH